MSSKPFCLLLAVGALGSTSGCSSRGEVRAQPLTEARPSQTPSPPRDDIAQRALAQLRHLVANDKGRYLAGASPVDLNGATLGRPIPIYRAPISRLKERPVSGDLRDVLIEDHEFLYPVLSNGQVRSSVIVAQGPDGVWKPGAVGYANLGGLIDKIGRQIVESRGETQFSLIEIPRLHMRFLWHADGGRMIVTPLRSVDATSLRAGTPREATAALNELAPLVAKEQSEGDESND